MYIYSLLIVNNSYICRVSFLTPIFRKPVLNELKTALTPYMLFWEDWIRDEACFLEKKEINIVVFHLKNNFTWPLFMRAPNYRPIIEENIIWKLKFHRPSFNNWVIFRFLCVLIQIAKRYGYASFFDTPIKDLKLPHELKSSLASFKTHTVRQLFEAYTEEDFKRSWVYTTILAFHRIYFNQKSF